MQLCYLLPGILGSELLTGPTHASLLWVDYTRLLFGQFGKLRLDASGTRPGGDDGVECFAGDPLPNYYAFAITLLSDSLRNDDYKVNPWGYDWRKDMIIQGVLLANDIRRRVSADAPCTILGHSQGGLVARAAWASLVGTGEQGKVRRIITLGTPHFGSYAAVEIFCLSSDNVIQITSLTLQAAYIQRAIIPVPLITATTVEEISVLAGTWPAVYQLFPSLDGGGEDEDPNRALLYSAGAWPQERGLSGIHLHNAATVWRTFLASPASMPPGTVLTTAAGVGERNGFRLVDPQALGTPEAIAYTMEGDGKVAAQSALIADSRRYVLNAMHPDLLNVAVASGQMREWILDVRQPPDPTSPATAVPGFIHPLLAGPPIPAPQLGPGRGPVQRRG